MSQRNRREFLEDSMVVAATAAVTAGSGAELLGHEVVRSSPAEKLGVAVVGVIGRGGSHIGAFAGRKDTQILYIVDADREIGGQRTEEVARRQGNHAPQFVEDLRAALDDPRVDIVSIATPNHTHALFAIWAMQAGKDVYVEKPVSHNVSEGRRMVQAARKYGRICQAGTQCRSNPGMIAAMEFLHAGGIGRVQVARGICHQPRRSIGARGEYELPGHVNYNLWLGPAAEAPLTRPQLHYDWHCQWPYGNGDVGNQGIHQMDIARWGLNVDTLSQAVVSYGGRFGRPDAGDTANAQVILHDYGDQTLVLEVHGLPTKSKKYGRVGVIFEGTEGRLVISGYDKGAAFGPRGEKIAEFKGGGDHFANFLRAVRSRNHRDLHADIEEGHLSSALGHLGNISYRLGAELPVEQVAARLPDFPQHDTNDTLQRLLTHLRDHRLDLEKLSLRVGRRLAIDPLDEQFPGDEPANALLTREYREPFVVPLAEHV